MRRKTRSFAWILVALLAFGGATIATAGPPEAHVDTNGRTVIWSIDFEYGTAELQLTGPKKFATLRSFEDGQQAYFEVFDDAGKELPDGRYSWEITYVSPISKGLAEEIRKARLQNNEEFVCELMDTGEIQSHGYSGSFTKIDGKFFLPIEEDEKSAELAAGIERPSAEKLPGPVTGAGSRAAQKDQVILDDLIVDGSACIGFDCVNGEAFGFDTIRLKENNLRIKFDDTSTVGSFPKTDWQLTANSSANGGQAKFSIDDISGGRTPFTVEANAPNNALYVDDGGRVGVGTSTPSVEMHLIDGDTPTLRLQQDTSSGFQAQTWDVAGNETNFFIRDASNGSTLPLRIRPGAPSDAIFVDPDGQVGFGDSSPDASFDLRGVDTGSSALSFDFENTSTSTTWFFQNDQDDSFKISKEGSGGAELTINERLDGGGTTTATLVVDGSVQATNVTFSSSRELKTDFVAVDPASVLDRLAGVEIQEWRYKNEPAERRHMGPIAEDFAAAFGLGASDKHITVTDVNGVALAAIQALHERIVALEQELAEQSCEIE